MTDETGSRRTEIPILVAILLAGLAIRLWLIRFPGYTVDVTLFTDWTNGLLRIPLDEYYGLVSPWCDYLPGYLYILAATGRLKELVSGPGPFVTQDFEPWIKMGPILADLVLGVVVFKLCRRYTSAGRSLLAASLVILNPGVMFVSAVWGQVESVASALYMLSLLALVSGNPIAAAIWAGLGFVTKPQYAILLGVIGVAYLRSDLLRLPSIKSPGGGAAWARWAVNRVALPVAVLIGTVQLLLLPFSTSLWPMPGVEWTFSYRVSIAEIGSFASAGAFNLWGTQIAGIRKLDSLTGWFSLSYQAWGFVLFAATAALVLLLTWRRSRDPGAVLWATFLLAFGFFEVLTKMHARYLFSAIPVLAAATAFRAWMLPYCLAVSALYFVNVWYIWAYQQDIFANLAVTQWVSDFSVLMFVASVIAAMLIALSTRVTVSHRMDLWHLSPSTRKWIRTRFPIALLSGAFHRPLSVKAGVGILAIMIALVVGVTLGMAAQAGRDQAGNPFKTATVRAYRSWQDTGVEVVAGQKISMMASGLWMHQMEGELYGPGGSGKIEDKSIIMSWAPTGVLLGRIGNSDPFVVGKGATVSAATSGSLQLVMNDWLKRDPQGSRGRVRVIIMVNDP